VLLIVNFLRNILYIINLFFHLFLWPLYGWPSIYDLNKALHTTLEIEQHEHHNNPEVKAAPAPLVQRTRSVMEIVLYTRIRFKA
jgi:hypothetical protein